MWITNDATSPPITVRIAFRLSTSLSIKENKDESSVCVAGCFDGRECGGRAKEAVDRVGQERRREKIERLRVGSDAHRRRRQSTAKERKRDHGGRLARFSGPANHSHGRIRRSKAFV